MKIGERTFVSLSYELEVAGKIVDSAGSDHPLDFIYGMGFLLPKFEEHINGLKKGDKFKFTLSPADGYGEIVAEALVELPKSIFVVDDAIEEGLLEVGNSIPMSTAEGEHMMGVVLEIGEEVVKMDFNHPMAGKTLNFSGEVEGVREATDEDMMAIMGGGANCGGGCGGCDDDDCEDGSCGCESGGCN